MLLLSVIKGDGERRQFLGMCVLEDENLLQILFTLRTRTREGISFVVVSIKFITDVRCIQNRNSSLTSGNNRFYVANNYHHFLFNLTLSRRAHNQLIECI